MFLPPPEVAALAQALPPSPLLQQSMESFRDLQSVVAVLESQAGFELDQNLARFLHSSPFEMPSAEERVRYLGFFLTDKLDPARELKIQLRFRAHCAQTPLVLMLHAFGIQGKYRFRLTQGISLYAAARVNAAGLAAFVFAPLAEVLKKPERVQGFMVYLLRPRMPESDEQTDELPVWVNEDTPSGVLRVQEGLNVYKRVDTRA